MAGRGLAAHILATRHHRLRPRTADPTQPSAGDLRQQPGLYTLDLLLPIINLGQEDTYRTTGGTQYVATLLILAGWVLTTAVVAGMTRLLNRS